MTELLGAEGADSVQSETEDQPVLLAQAHVECGKLGRHGAAVPGMAERHRGIDQRAVFSPWSLLKVEEERRAAEEAAVAIAEKRRRAPLRAAQRTRLETPRIGETGQRRNELDGSCVVKTLKHLNQRARQAEGRGQRTQTAAVRVEIGAHVGEEMADRKSTRLNSSHVEI